MSGASTFHPGRIWACTEPYGLMFVMPDATHSTFFDLGARVASTGPGTYLKRCGSKFCVGWWSRYLHSFHMDPIGEKIASKTVKPPAAGAMGHGPPVAGAMERDQAP